MVIICKLIIFGVAPFWGLYKLIKSHNRKSDIVLLRESGGDSRVGKHHALIHVLLLGLCMIGTIVLLEWGMLSLYLGNQKNANLSRIRKNGTRMAAQVVSCEFNEKYSSNTVIIYTYFVDFVVNEQVKRGATMSFLYYPEGSVIDIYYLPYQNGILGGVALADDNGNWGKVKINHGILGIIAAFFCFLFWIEIKKGHVIIYKEEAEQPDSLKAFEQMKEKEKKKYESLLKIGTIILFCMGIFCLFFGLSQNRKVSQIKEQGIKTEAVVKRYEFLRRFSKAESHRREYFVEFIVNGQKVQGKTISRANYIRGDCVEIYYLPETKQELRDVVFSNEKEGLGNDYIFYAELLLMLFAGAFYEIVKKKN